MHGGPAAYALLDYDSNVFWQVLCSRGWSVLALNAVGSATYGREFCQRLAGHWGEYDLPQHLAAIRPADKVLTMATMRFADEVVAPDELGEDVVPQDGRKLDKREVDMAKQLI